MPRCLFVLSATADTRSTAVAVVVVIAELIAGFAEEYELIWKGRRGLERNIFLVCVSSSASASCSEHCGSHRYVVPIGLICAAHSQSSRF